MGKGAVPTPRPEGAGDGGTVNEGGWSVIEREMTHEVINQGPNGEARDLSARATPEAMSAVKGSSADLPEDLEQLRARARERDQFLNLLRRSRADFENFQKRVRRERE